MQTSFWVIPGEGDMEYFEDFDCAFDYALLGAQEGRPSGIWCRAIKGLAARVWVDGGADYSFEFSEYRRLAAPNG